MIFAIRTMGKLKINQPVVWYSRSACQIRNSHSYKNSTPYEMREHKHDYHCLRQCHTEGANISDSVTRSTLNRFHAHNLTSPIYMYSMEFHSNSSSAKHNIIEGHVESCLRLVPPWQSHSKIQTGKIQIFYLYFCSWSLWSYKTTPSILLQWNAEVFWWNSIVARALPSTILIYVSIYNIYVVCNSMVACALPSTICIYIYVYIYIYIYIYI